MNWDWDVALMSYMDIEGLIKGEGYCNIQCLWDQDPKFSFSLGLRPLNNDQDVLKFVQDVRGFKVVDVYVEHKVEEVNIEDVNFEDVDVEEVNDEEKNCEDVNVEDGDVEEVNDEDANCKDVTFEDVNVENCDDADDYEESDDSDEWNLGPDVGVDWTTVLPNASAEKISRKNDISDEPACDSDELYTPPASDDEGDIV